VRGPWDANRGCRHALAIEHSPTLDIILAWQLSFLQLQPSARGPSLGSKKGALPNHQAGGAGIKDVRLDGFAGVDWLGSLLLPTTKIYGTLLAASIGTASGAADEDQA